jgi:hypothetical protein
MTKRRLLDTVSNMAPAIWTYSHNAEIDADEPKPVQEEMLLNARRRSVKTADDETSCRVRDALSS